MLRNLASDVRAAAAAMRSAPLSAAVTIVTLALGIGSATAVFRVASALLLRPLAVHDPQRLTTITSETALRMGFAGGAGWSYAMWNEFRGRSQPFAGAFAWTVQRVDLATGGEAQPADVLVASGSVFETLGLRAVRGRLFTDADDVRGGGPAGGVVVVSHSFWQRHLAGAATAVGTRLSVEGVPLTIIGITEESFRGVDVGQQFDIAMPFGVESMVHGANSFLDQEGSLVLTIMLRLRPDQTVATATTSLRAMQPQILGSMRRVPSFLKEPFVLAPAANGISDRSGLRNKYEQPLVILSVISLLVLAVACVNVANLLFARTATRTHEWAVRMAIGSSRLRVARHVIIDAMVLALLATALGALMSVWVTRLILANVPVTSGDVHLNLSHDWRLWFFVLVVDVVVVGLIGLMPAYYASRVPLAAVAHGEGRALVGTRWGALSAGLVLGQTAMSIVLLAGCGLFIGTMSRLSAVPLGFVADRVTVATIDMRRVTANVPLPDRILEAVRRAPGIDRAAASMWLPIGSGGGGILADARGRAAAASDVTAFNFVSPGWFDVFGIPLRAGRDFNATDHASAPRVAVINESLMRLRFPAGGAVGATLAEGPCTDCVVIIGVVADAVYGRSLRDRPPPTVYMPLAQSAGGAPPGAPLQVTVRKGDSSTSVTLGLSEALASVDRNLSFRYHDLRADLDTSLAQERLVAFLASFFGVMALLLSALGSYGVASRVLISRRAEIGLRLALGAAPWAAIAPTIGRIVTVVVAGVAVGLLASAWLSTFVAPLLYGVEPGSAWVLLLSAAVLIVVVAAAVWIPASRAARLDPATILRVK